MEYLDAINSGGVPTISSSIERVISTEIRKVVEEVREEFYKILNEKLGNDKMPMEDDDFLNLF